MKDRTGGNKNLYCDYHKAFGHKTQDCFDLKDALEQAIQEGKLAEFSHLIREPGGEIATDLATTGAAS